MQVNSVGPRIAGFVPQLPRHNVTNNSTSTAPVQPSGTLPRPFNVNEGSIADRRSNKGVLPENALVLDTDLVDLEVLDFLISPHEGTDMIQVLKDHYELSMNEVVQLNEIVNEAMATNQPITYESLDYLLETSRFTNIRESIYEVLEYLNAIDIYNGNVMPVIKSYTEIHQKLMDLGIINAQGEIQGDKLEDPATLRAFNTFMTIDFYGEKIISGQSKRIIDMIYKKYDTYYLNEFNEYHWVRYLNSFEVPKASDQQLVIQTDTLHSNTGQEIFDRLLASTILVRSNTDEKIIINNPKDIKPDVFRVLKDAYGVEFAMAIGMDLDNKLNRPEVEPQLIIDDTPAPLPVDTQGNGSGLRMSRKLLIMLAAAALGSTFNSH
jgi:hypothetical protein